MGAQNGRPEPFGSLKEQERATLQDAIDNRKTIESRRRFGQFATPFPLADEIVQYALKLCHRTDISFLEPCLGTGVFYSAMKKNFKGNLLADGFEIDGDYFRSAKELWRDINVRNEDFTTAKASKVYDLLITNPPYVRHHYLSQDQKDRLQQAVFHGTGINISKLAGLYCYFILLADKWLKDGALSAWLIPSEFMDVNYGQAIKDYLLNHVHLLRIHRYEADETQFDDALVSSCVIWYRKETVEGDYDVEFSYGGSHDNPKISRKIPKSVLLHEHKWTRFPAKEVRQNKDYAVLGDFFHIKRGIATGSNSFFILERGKAENLGIEPEFLQPILPSPRYLNVDYIASDNGFPRIDKQLVLVNCPLDEEQIKEKVAWQYLQQGINTIATKYLCKSRKVWYWQEQRRATPFLCSYMGRGKDNASPIRFILNMSDAIVTNSYLMLYPKRILQEVISQNPNIILDIWEELKHIGKSAIEDEGRIYGGGLKKIEPRELAKVRCDGLKKFCSGYEELTLYNGTMN